MKSRRWSDMSSGQKSATVVGAIVQMTLAAAAWNDLAKRPAASVRGRKAVWAGVIAVNFVGPLAYFRWGRLSR